jgi:alpha-amylase/alpha-mannosidase (GH57 family)
MYSGHFYQPPRKSMAGKHPARDSAAPYHDWNERITAECTHRIRKRAFSVARKNREITSNYSKISFNFDDIAWLDERKMPEVHTNVAADKVSQARFSGHGSAIAQVYNHMILPLANARDKQTKVLWGIRDFEYRFGRTPEGMWLSETAADTETLDVLAQCGVKFTILSPFQASRVREMGNRNWRDVNGGHIDPKQPYLMKLRSGRTITVFFMAARYRKPLLLSDC